MPFVSGAAPSITDDEFWACPELATSKDLLGGWNLAATADLVGFATVRPVGRLILLRSAPEQCNIQKRTDPSSGRNESFVDILPNAARNCASYAGDSRGQSAACAERSRCVYKILRIPQIRVGSLLRKQSGAQGDSPVRPASDPSGIPICPDGPTSIPYDPGKGLGIE
jgi:hypothetical protein